MKITLHRALARVKTTKARLDNIVSGKDLILVDIYSNKNKVCMASAKNEEDTKKIIQGNWDKFNSLYRELVNLKRAITLSNAGLSKDQYNPLEKLTVCGEKYTAAEIISLADVLLYKKRWLLTIKKHYVSVVDKFSKKQEQINAELDSHIRMMLGADTKKSDTSVKGFSDMYLEQNGHSLVDPLDLMKKIDTLEKEIDAFDVEADAALSEANALRTIDIDLVE